MGLGVPIFWLDTSHACISCSRSCRVVGWYGMDGYWRARAQMSCPMETAWEDFPIWVRRVKPVLSAHISTISTVRWWIQSLQDVPSRAIMCHLKEAEPRAGGFSHLQFGRDSGRFWGGLGAVGDDQGAMESLSSADHLRLELFSNRWHRPDRSMIVWPTGKTSPWIFWAPPGTISFELHIRALQRIPLTDRNEWHDVKWHATRQASRQQPDVGAYTSLLSALDRDGRWEVALAFGDTVMSDGVEVQWRTSCAMDFPMKGDGHQPIGILGFIHGPSGRSQTWSECRFVFGFVDLEVSVVHLPVFGYLQVLFFRWSSYRWPVLWQPLWWVPATLAGVGHRLPNV